MSDKNTMGFRCYICGRQFPDQTQRAKPCAYDKFDQATCLECCEECHNLPPFNCAEYNRRKRREARKA